MKNIFRRERNIVPEAMALQEIEERHNLSQQVYVRREELGITQQQLASAAGMTQPQVANLEAGQSNPTHWTLVRLAHALGCTVSDLYEPLESRDDCLEVAVAAEELIASANQRGFWEEFVTARGVSAVNFVVQDYGEPVSTISHWDSDQWFRAMLERNSVRVRISKRMTIDPEGLKV